jgi:hypothetical protein
MSLNVRVFPSRSSVMNIPLSGAAAAVFLVAAVAAVLISTQSVEAALAAVAVGAFCVCLMIVPTFWMAVVLVVLIPFQTLISELLGRYGSNARQVFAAWKVVLLLIGIFRVLRNNPNRRQIMVANRWVLSWSGLLILAYCVAFLRAPSIPAVFSLDFETRFLCVMWFFMFLHLDEKRKATLLRVMLWSIGLLAIYGIIQYFWDYDRLLPFVNSPDAFDYGQRRLYSYSLTALEPAYAAVIAILILFSGVLRNGLRAALSWIAILVPCLLLTYTRSAYLGLLAGVIALCIIDHTKLRRIAAVGLVAICLICGSFLFGGDATSRSSLGQRLQSIVSQNDESSLVHKERMRTAVQVISANPFGVGLGKYGTVEAKFVGVEDAQYTENWVLQVAVGAGVVAAFAFVGLTATLLWSLLRRQCSEAHNATLVAAAVSILTAMTIAGVMIPVWDFQIPVVYTWALVGMAIATCDPRKVGHPVPPYR